MIILETKDKKVVKSKNYNTVFNKDTGFFARWGKTEEDDPIMAPLPEIADIEISSGRCHNNCPFCYKSNTSDGELHNMTLNEFKNIFHKIAKTIVKVTLKNDVVLKNPIDKELYENFNTKQEMINSIIIDSLLPIEETKIYNEGLLNQIAFGITSPEDNPDFFKIMEYARDFDVIPNYTIKAADMTEEIAEKTINLCGACAISMSNDKEMSYRAIKMLKPLKQVNIHQVAMDSTYNRILEIIEDIHKGIISVNALVLLKYKPKGTNAGKFKPLTKEQYRTIFELARKYNVGIGFDSCSAPIYLDMLDDNEKDMAMYAEPCESTLFSIYINSYGLCYPCSFSEDEKRNKMDWTKGINVLTCKDFEQDIWKNPKIVRFRNKLIKNNRHCPMFDLEWHG